MNRKQYEAMRKKLMDEAQALIDEGRAEDAQKKMDEVKELDEKWDIIAQTAANFAALNNEPRPNATVPVADAFGEEEESGETKAITLWKSEDYKKAWAKTLMGKQLTGEEQETFRLVNEAFTHNTQNTGTVIPETVAKGIWEMAGEMYPYFEDVTKTYVNGTLFIIQEDTSSEAHWYEESETTEDGKETFKQFKLSGCELSRAITVSWKLREMAMEDFIPYIQRKMAKKMGAGAGYGVTYGAGENAESGKPEPTGTVTALLKETGTPQVVTYKKDNGPTYKDITAARAKIKSGYGAGTSVYANNETIWNKVANITDQNGRPIFMVDPSGSSECRILGMKVKEDASMKDGDILLSNPSSGYHLNINKEVSMIPEEHVKSRTTDYCGYAVMDGNILTPKAHALLTEAQEENTDAQG